MRLPAAPCAAQAGKPQSPPSRGGTEGGVASAEAVRPLQAAALREGPADRITSEAPELRQAGRQGHDQRTRSVPACAARGAAGRRLRVPSPCILLSLALCLATSAYGEEATVAPDGFHTIQIGVNRSGTAQADVLANGGMYAILVQLDAAAAAKYAIVEATLRWNCEEGSFAGKTDGQTYVIWLSPDSGDKRGTIIVSGQLRSLNAAGAGGPIDFVGQLDATIYEPLLLFENLEQYQAVGDTQTYTVSAEVYAKFGEEQKSISGFMMVEWKVMSDSGGTADKALRGKTYSVQARVAPYEDKFATATAAVSQPVHIVGVEIEGADETTGANTNEWIEFTANGAPAGGAYVWSFSHDPSYYEIDGDTDTAQTLRIRMLQTVDDFKVDVEYTTGTVTTASSRREANGALVSDAANVDAGIQFWIQRYYGYGKEIRQFEDTFFLGFVTSAFTKEGLLEGVRVKIGGWTLTASDLSDPGFSQGVTWQCWYNASARCRDIDVGRHEIEIIPLSPRVVVKPPIVPVLPDGKSELVVIKLRIEDHDTPEWVAVGEAVTLTATVDGVSPSEGEFEWSVPGGAAAVDGQVLSGPGATTTVSFKYTQGTSIDGTHASLRFRWPKPGVTSPFVQKWLDAKREDGDGSMLDHAVFRAFGLKRIDGLPEYLLPTGESFSLSAIEDGPAVNEQVDGDKGTISWQVQPSNLGGFNPVSSQDTHDTTFTTNTERGEGTIIATYTRAGKTATVSASIHVGNCRITHTPEYAVVGSFYDDIENRPVEFTAQGYPAGGTFGWDCLDSMAWFDPEDAATTKFKPGNAGTLTIQATYNGEESPNKSVQAYRLEMQIEADNVLGYAAAGQAVTVNATIMGYLDEGTEPARTWVPDALGNAAILWEASDTQGHTVTGAGHPFSFPLTADTWTVTAHLEHLASVSATTTVKGTRLHIVGHDEVTTIESNTPHGLNAALLNAPEGMDGVYTWTGSENAKFLYNGDWVSGPVTTTAASVSAKFSQGSAEETVDVTFAATDPYAGIQLAAKRPVTGAFGQFVLDTAVFAVEGVAIVKKPEYALWGQTMDVMGRATTLSAKVVLAPEGGTFDWTTTQGPGDGSFLDHKFGPTTSTATFRGDAPGEATIKVAYTKDNSTSSASTTLTVYSLRMELQRTPNHGWVQVGNTVRFEAKVYGDPGTPANEEDDVELAFQPDDMHWTVEEGNGPATTTTGSSTTVTVSVQPTYVTAALKVQRQGTTDPPVELVHESGSTRGVRLTIAAYDTKETICTGQTLTLLAALAADEMDGLPPGAGGTYTWSAVGAQFKEGATWRTGDLPESSGEAELCFTEANEDAKVELTFQTMAQCDDGTQQLVTLTAKRVKVGTTDQYEPDPALFEVVKPELYGGKYLDAITLYEYELVPSSETYEYVPIPSNWGPGSNNSPVAYVKGTHAKLQPRLNASKSLSWPVTLNVKADDTEGPIFATNWSASNVQSWPTADGDFVHAVQLPNQVGIWQWKPTWKCKTTGPEAAMNQTTHKIFTFWATPTCDARDLTLEKVRYSCDIGPAATLNEIATKLAIKVRRRVGPWSGEHLLYWYVLGDNGRAGPCYARNRILQRALAVLGITSQLDWVGEHRWIESRADCECANGKRILPHIEYHWFLPKRTLDNQKAWNFEYFNVLNGRVYDAYLAHKGMVDKSPADYRRNPDEAGERLVIERWFAWEKVNVPPEKPQ